jgi:regulator of protease activity HflC (stomatin/prohibitin superfamily)
MSLREQPVFRMNGFFVLAGLIALGLGSTAVFVQGAQLADHSDGPPWVLLLGVLGWVVFGFVAPGFVAIQPNEARVLTVFGRYVGSIREAGFWWVNPFSNKRRVSLRVRNFNSEHLKVNDANGNPIEIGAVVVWSVVDAARAVFEVENYESFVSIQAESAIRTLATRYAYDSHEDGHPSLRGNPDEISQALQEELHHKLESAGVKVVDARIAHLAYAPEIAQAMLRRQQAQAVIAARKQIVEGAVSMVQMALARLAENHIVELDEERKANMVSNLLVVLVGENDTQPVINAGTLY